MIAMKPPHKFFERHLTNDLESLSMFLTDVESKMQSGEFFNIGPEDVELGKKTDCFATSLAHTYNVFQLYHPGIYNLYNAVRDMTIEACNYYGVNFKEQKYYIQGWFNLDKREEFGNKDSLNPEDLHDHGDGSGIPYFHGYYCVNAEPSVTHYFVNREAMFENVNVNNRAILSEIGHPHRKGSWPYDQNRITIAYDMVTHESLQKEDFTQHWIPLI